jgi:hypothetical protein
VGTKQASTKGEKSMSGEEHLKASAMLRGQSRFAEAVAEIENNIATFDEVTIVPALLQALYAAHEGGNPDKARALAQQLAKYDPNIPSVKKYLP